MSKTFLSAALVAVSLISVPALAENAAAVIDGTEIPMAKVEDQVRGELLALEQQAYDLRRRALDAIIYEMLLEKEAEKAGRSSASEQMNAIVEERVEDPSTEAIETFIAANQQLSADDPNARNQARDQLRSQAAREVQMAYLSSLRDASEITIAIQPPRFDVPIADHNPISGPDTAPVTIVEFSDFECPYCSRVQPTLRQIEAAYGDQVRLVFRQMPLSFHQNARKAAAASLCAEEQDRFSELSQWMFSNHRALGGDGVLQGAKETGLDVVALSECMDSGRYAAMIDADIASATSIGANSTPTFFINGRMIKGAQRFEAFKALIDEELELNSQAADGSS